jgi:hypothetical protein
VQIRCLDDYDTALGVTTRPDISPATGTDTDGGAA